MCGISGMLLKSTLTHQQKIQLQKDFFNASRNINHRGPDRSSYTILSDPVNIMIDFERLSILDLSTKGDQPFKYENETGNRTIYVMCNGEIYNHNELCKEHDLHPVSGSDCEVIPLLYKKYGITEIDKICNMFNSEHAFMILDVDTVTGDYTLVLSSDRFGIRPLFVGWNDQGFYFSSELQGLPCLSDMTAHVERFKPRCYAIITKQNGIMSDLQYHQYYSFQDIKIQTCDLQTYYDSIYTSLNNAVIARLDSDRPYGCLLSGGVDSSLVSALAAKHLAKFGKTLRTFSIGMPGGTDEKFAKIVAEYIGSIHTHIMVSEYDFVAALPHIVNTIGSFDITTVRASTGQYLISQWISKNTDIKVLLCGDGSDEVCGSYKYFHNAPNSIAFNEECIRLLEDIHLYDGLRADRCIAHFGIEARFPFLDYHFTEAYLSCDPAIRMPQDQVEKWLLRQSFKQQKILPEEVLFRSKEAFSDGVSSQKRSWYQVIQENVKNLYTDEEFTSIIQNYEHLKPVSKESLWFRELFCKKFGENISVSKTIPYYWLPKWNGDITEPSARVLSSYK